MKALNQYIKESLLDIDDDSVSSQAEEYAASVHRRRSAVHLRKLMGCLPVSNVPRLCLSMVLLTVLRLFENREWIAWETPKGHDTH